MEACEPGQGLTAAAISSRRRLSHAAGAAAAAGVVCGRNERRDNNGDGRGTSLLAECQRGEHFPGSEGEALYAQDAYDEALLWPPCAGGAAAAVESRSPVAHGASGVRPTPVTSTPAGVS